MHYRSITGLLLTAAVIAVGRSARGEQPPGIVRLLSSASDAPVASDAQTGHEYLPPPPVPGFPQENWEPQTPLSAGADRAYSLNELLNLAVQNNPTIRQARLHITGLLGQAIQAGLYPNPVANYEAEQIGVDSEFDTDTPGEFHGGRISQRIVTGGKLQLSRDKYEQRAQVAEYLAVAQEFRVCNDVRVHFYRTLAARQILDLQRELLKTAEDRVLTARELFNLGQATRPEIHRTNIALQQHRLNVLMAENTYRQHFLTLTSLVGIELAEAPLNGQLEYERELIDFDAAYGDVVARSPEMHAAWAKLREDQITLERERIQWIPDLIVSGGAGYNFESRESVGVAGVAIEVPFFDRNQGTVRQARADLARQQSEVERTRLRLRRLLADEYQRYLTAFQHVRNFESVILPEARDAYESLLKSYGDNRAEWPDVLDAQESYAQLRIQYLHHLTDLRTSDVLINGFLLHGGLEAAQNATPPGHIDATPKPR